MFNKKSKLIVTIDGMHCIHCATKVRDHLLKIEGVNKVDINLENKKTVIIGKNDIEEEKVKEVIETLDYRVICIDKC